MLYGFCGSAGSVLEGCCFYHRNFSPIRTLLWERGGLPSNRDLFLAMHSFVALLYSTNLDKD